MGSMLFEFRWMHSNFSQLTVLPDSAHRWATSLSMECIRSDSIPSTLTSSLLKSAFFIAGESQRQASEGLSVENASINNCARNQSRGIASIWHPTCFN